MARPLEVRIKLMTEEVFRTDKFIERLTKKRGDKANRLQILINRQFLKNQPPVALAQ